MEKPITASAVIGIAQKIEDYSSAFYGRMAEKYSSKETFINFAKESVKIKVVITRTYQETISDALEACFSFKDFDTDRYSKLQDFLESVDLSKGLERAIKLEERAAEFYSEAAAQSRSLLATITNAFAKAAKEHDKRKLTLESLLHQSRHKTAIK